MKDNRTPGINCPQCNQFIPTSITELISASFIDCPHCRLRLTLDKEQSQRAIQALEKVDIAQCNLENKSKFNGKGR